MYWNPEVLTRIDAADDLKIAPYHPDMNTTGTPTSRAPRYHHDYRQRSKPAGGDGGG